MWSFIIGSAVVALAGVPGVLLVWLAARNRREEALQTARVIAHRRRYH